MGKAQFLQSQRKKTYHGEIQRLQSRIFRKYITVLGTFEASGHAGWYKGHAGENDRGQGVWKYWHVRLKQLDHEQKGFEYETELIGSYFKWGVMSRVWQSR